MLKEFKEFIAKGNVIDLAVGLVIGAAFGKIITSLVADVVMPPIGMLLGGVDFNNLFVTLKGQHFDTLKAAKDGGAVTVNYGVFISTCIEFLIVAFVIFLVVKAVNRLKRQPAELPPTMKACAYCCSSIAIEATRCPQCTSDLKAA
ncbi:MAG TPA: large-conductance mechanosensitive channel protein MscL [Blastocatellia bacterium]|jgi:large conductance mechanosensitive channel|nr:large-conductance mechanosensitive channel protein MscL [Blastocatellia bacterium]